MDIIIPTNKQNIILDATLLSAIMNCPRFSNFRFKMNLQSINGKSNSLECGSIVHKVLEIYYKSIINGIKKSDAIGFGLTAGQLYVSGCQHCTNFISTPEIIKPICGHMPNDYLGTPNTPQESEGYKIGWKWVFETCEQYFDYYRADHWVPLETEVVKGKILYEDDEIRILWKAKLDLIVDTNQGIYSIDHKTMKQRRNMTSLNNQFIGQCLIMNTRNVFINKIGFQTTLKPEEKFARPPVSYTAARLLEWQSEILPYYAKLLLMYNETNHFPPDWSHCETKYGDCMFMKICESDPGMREEELKLHFIVGPEWNPTNELVDEVNYND